MRRAPQSDGVRRADITSICHLANCLLAMYMIDNRFSGYWRRAPESSSSNCVPTFATRFGSPGLCMPLIDVSLSWRRPLGEIPLRKSENAVSKREGNMGTTRQRRRLGTRRESRCVGCETRSPDQAAQTERPHSKGSTTCSTPSTRASSWNRSARTRDRRDWQVCRAAYAREPISHVPTHKNAY